MTCYFRHMREMFEEIGIEVTPENKKDIDRAIHTLVHVTYKDCPATWRAVKERLAQDQAAFLADLRTALAVFI
jgi:8-oxo-dGTP pyrophosphatase MutT (NUDIX family)